MREVIINECNPIDEQIDSLLVYAQLLMEKAESKGVLGAYDWQKEYARIRLRKQQELLKKPK